MVDLYVKFNMASEGMMLGMCFIMLILIWVTQPRTSILLRITVNGFGLGMLTIIAHIINLYMAKDIARFSTTTFDIVYIIYCVLYALLLVSVFLYIDLLSYRRRNDLKHMIIMMVVLSVIFLVIMLFPVFTGRLYTVDSDGKLMVSNWVYCVNLVGVIDAIICFITTLTNKREVTSVVSLGLLVFAPLEIFILAIQAVIQASSLVSYTCVLPFLIFYILFHCTKYDDVVGCQSADALDSQIDKAIRTNKKYLLINMQFPQLQKREFGDIRNIIDYVSSQKCREIERFLPGIRLYSSSIYSYYLFTTIDSDDQAKIIIDGIERERLKPIVFNGKSFPFYSKLTIITNNDIIKTAKHANAFIGFLNKRFSSNMENECIIANQKDCEDFEIYYRVLQALLDIRMKNSLDDDRVVCFIQPIHNIATNSFRTGESLMRMQLDGKMIFPDQFIEVAESNDCIHALTRIMLTKVCKKIKFLEDEGYDFEAITVNCSTLELADWDLHQELFDIISSHGIDPSHIKIEITESTSISNYDSILHNMQRLNEDNVSFYLDDFGTGYSNLERIMNYPFKTIKFDKSIMYDALSNDKMDELMRMLVAFFKRQGLKAVIEGVEDDRQYEYCKEMGFDYVQGYLFAKPQPADNIVNYFVKK